MSELLGTISASDQVVEFTISNESELPVKLAVNALTSGQVALQESPNGFVWDAVTDSGGDVILTPTRKQALILAAGRYRVSSSGLGNPIYMYLVKPYDP